MTNGDGDRIVREIAEIKVILTERERSVEAFRIEIREGFHAATQILKEHTYEDTRRFEKVDTLLNEKITGLYEHLEAHANAQRTRAWQITGIALTTFLSLGAMLITAYRFF